MTKSFMCESGNSDSKCSMKRATPFLRNDWYRSWIGSGIARGSIRSMTMPAGGEPGWGKSLPPTIGGEQGNLERKSQSGVEKYALAKWIECAAPNGTNACAGAPPAAMRLLRVLSYLWKCGKRNTR
jgi:hypothetical protein